MRDGIWVPTYSGEHINLLAPDPGSIHLRDIAHQLALTNRYLGITVRPYSVAEHSCRMAVAASRMGFAGWTSMPVEALLHDAHEAYVGDISRRIVMAVPEFARLRDIVDGVVRQRFNLLPRMPSRLQDMDRAICRLEIRSGLIPNPDRVECMNVQFGEINGTEDDAEMLRVALEGYTYSRPLWKPNDRWGWHWSWAEREFLRLAERFGIQ